MAYHFRDLSNFVIMVPKHIFEIKFFEIKFEITVTFFQNYKPQIWQSYRCVEITVFEIPVFKITLLTQKN